jgi:hypothetical protein
MLQHLVGVMFGLDGPFCMMDMLEGSSMAVRLDKASSAEQTGMQSMSDFSQSKRSSGL